MKLKYTIASFALLLGVIYYSINSYMSFHWYFGHELTSLFISNRLVNGVFIFSFIMVLNYFIARGIDRLEKVQQALRENEDKYRTLVQNVNIGVYRNIPGPQGHFLHANPAIAKMFGYGSVEEFMGVKVSDLYQDPEERQEFVDEMTENGFVKDREIRLKKKDGAPIWGSVTAQAHRGPSGTIDWMDGIIEDISERKLADNLLKESEERYRVLIENSPDLIGILQEGRFRYVNRALCEKLGWECRDILADDFLVVDKIIPERLRPLIYENIDKRLRGENIPPYEINVVRKDGVEFPVMIQAGRISFNGKPADEITMVDITERKRTEEQKEKLAELHERDRMKNEFMSMVSHELRTPLTSIIGFVSILQQELTPSLKEEQRTLFARVKANAKHLEDLIDSILDVTRIASGQKFEIKKEPLSIKQEIGEAVEGLKPDLEKKELTLTVDIAPGIPAIIGDEAKIERVITNLLGNAIKFTPRKGSVTIRAAAEQEAVIIQIADTGVGIAADKMERIFERFYQADSSLTREYGGIGMGLTIAKEIIEGHGGRIWAESEGAGKGSAFFVSLPV